jgi:integration host factor subunit beta|tara:strand:- start:85 stop:366 length:282 start_codon:yes stop_codon:yes gene_type:complete
LSKPKIIQKLKIRNSNIGKKELEKIFDIFFQQISDALQDMRSIEIRSLGTFFIKEIKEKKQARNPRTGEIIYVPKRNKIRFRASKRLKEIINK